MTHLLFDSDGATLFTVSPADWNALDQRAAAAVQLSVIAEQVTQYLPGFEALVRSSQAWQDQTRPDVREVARTLLGYCDQALTDFGALQKALAGSPLTPDLQRQVVDTVTALATRTAPLDRRFHDVSAEVADFVEINQAVDAEVDAYVARFGTQWASILPQTRRIDDAAGRVRGVWEALGADLCALVSEPIEVTDAFVEGLEIDAALLGWQRLRDEAAAFDGGEA